MLQALTVSACCMFLGLGLRHGQGGEEVHSVHQQPRPVCCCLPHHWLHLSHCPRAATQGQSLSGSSIPACTMVSHPSMHQGHCTCHATGVDFPASTNVTLISLNRLSLGHITSPRNVYFPYVTVM